MNYFAFAAQNARREFNANLPPLGVPREHPCGQCAQPAEYVDRSMCSGAVLYICRRCNPDGHATLVQPRRFAPMEVRR